MDALIGRLAYAFVVNVIVELTIFLFSPGNTGLLHVLFVIRNNGHSYCNMGHMLALVYGKSILYCSHKGNKITYLI